MSDTPRLRVMTWNIHGCVGRDGKRDAQRVGAWVQALAPDVAAFQEVDARGVEPGQSEVHRYLRERVGDHGHEAWALSGADGRYGQLLASRFPLRDRQVHDISVPGREPRRIMEARVALPSLSLRVLATHLGLRRRERRYQLERLADIVMADSAAPTLLLGDFNEWRGGRGAPPSLSALFDVWRSHGTFPSAWPLLALDGIGWRPGNVPVTSRAAKEAHMASDHLPLVAELTLPSTDEVYPFGSPRAQT